MKKAITVILTTILMASVAAGCSEAPSHTTKTSSTTRERETTSASEETTTEPSETSASELSTSFPDPEGLTPISEGDHAITPEIEDMYYEAYSYVDELPGTPVALLATTENDYGTVYIIIENGGAMSYNGMDVFHITKVGMDRNGMAYANTEEYLDVRIGFGVDDTILNLPDSYEIDNDLLTLYTENAPDGYDTPFMHAATNNICDVFVSEGADNSIAFVSVGTDGSTEILLTYDYTPLL